MGYCSGSPEYIWPIIITGIALLVILKARNLYKVLEKLMMLMVMIMIITFIINIAFAAAFSSLTVNAVVGGNLLSDSLGLGRSMKESGPKLFTALVLVIGMLIAVFFKANIAHALVLAQEALNKMKLSSA